MTKAEKEIPVHWNCEQVVGVCRTHWFSIWFLSQLESFTFSEMFPRSKIIYIYKSIDIRPTISLHVKTAFFFLAFMSAYFTYSNRIMGLGKWFTTIFLPNGSTLTVLPFHSNDFMCMYRCIGAQSTESTTSCRMHTTHDTHQQEICVYTCLLFELYLWIIYQWHTIPLLIFVCCSCSIFLATVLMCVCECAFSVFSFIQTSTTSTITINISSLWWLTVIFIFRRFLYIDENLPFSIVFKLVDRSCGALKHDWHVYTGNHFFSS